MHIPWRQLAKALLLGLPIAMASGCKPARNGAAAEVKSLDNFAAGARVRANACSASPETKRSADFSEPMANADDGRIKIDAGITGAARDQLLAEVREALTAVPPELQVAIMSMGGYVDVTPRAKERCTRVFRLEGPQQTSEKALEYTSACFEFRPLTQLSDAELAELDLSKADLASGPLSGGKGSVFRINVAPDAKEIRHSLVRTFGYVVGQLFSRMAPANEAQKALGRKLQVSNVESAKFANLKIRVAQSFLADMAESSVFDLSTMESLLGAGSASTVRENFARLKKRGDISAAIDKNFADVPPGSPAYADEDLLNGVSFLYKGETGPLTRAQRKVRMYRFYDYVFAEFYDSIHCRTWGSYPAADVVAKVKAGTQDRDEFLRSAENTLEVAKDFFPRTFALYDVANQEIKGLATVFSAQSDFRDLLSAPSVGLSLTADDPLSMLAGLLGGAGGDPSALLAKLGGGNLTGLLNKLGPDLLSKASQLISKQGGFGGAGAGKGGGGGGCPGSAADPGGGSIGGDFSGAFEGGDDE